MPFIRAKLAGMKKLVDRKKKSAVKSGRAPKGQGSLRMKNGVYYYRVADPARPGKQIEGTCGTGDLVAAMGVKTEVIRKAYAVATIVTQPPKPDRAMVAEILNDYISMVRKEAEYKALAEPDCHDVTRALSPLVASVKHLTERLGHIVADELTSAHTMQYRTDRESGAFGRKVIFSTVNKDLAYLRAALIHARDKTTPPKVNRVTQIWFPSEKTRVRRGFIERHAEYAAIFPALSDSMKALFVCAFHTGARAGELKQIEWNMVDFKRRVIELRAPTTKNQEGRWIPIWGDMMDILLWQKKVRDEECPKCKWVFFKHRNSCSTRAVAGTKLGSHQRHWKTAVKSVGLPNAIFHDLRRSAIKYADQEAEMNPALVTHMSGHKTQAIYLRYNIRGGKESLKLGKALDEHLEKSGGVRVALKPVTSEPDDSDS